MSQDRSIILGVAVCVLFYLGYTQYMSKSYPDWNKPKPAAEQQADPTANKSAASIPSDGQTPGSAAPAGSPSEGKSFDPASFVALSADQLELANKKLSIAFDQSKASPVAVVLELYRSTYNKDASKLNITPNGIVVQALPGRERSALAPAIGFEGERNDERTLSFSRSFPPFRVTQTYHLPEDGYLLDFKVRIENVGSEAADLDLNLLMRELIRYPEAPGMLIPIPGVQSERPMFASVVNGESTWEDVQGICKDLEAMPAPPVLEGKESDVQVIGFDSHYYLSAVLPKAKPLDYAVTITEMPKDEKSCPAQILVSRSQGRIKPGEVNETDYQLYFGPKDNDIMQAAHPTLSKTIDFGWFSIIALPLLKALKWIYKYVGNYGLAIIIITILLKIAFYPLQKQASISAHRMKKLNPQMTKLRERFKDDPRKQQQELMKFMSANKVNPMKGCLPILPTIPIFIAYLRVLSSSIELRHAPFYGWIHDLTAPDPYYITPLVLTAAMFIQQKMTPMTGMDKNQERIMLIMPIMFGLMGVTFPAGMTIYMLANTIISIAQMKYIQRRLEQSEGKA